jgi:Outer membrane protein and related peptidoglycan-associated (lipo)proteins
MKRILLFLALVVLAVGVNAQGRYYYDSDKKYGFFSNWSLSPFAQASFMNGKTAFGAGGMALKQLDDIVRFRMEASVNGIKSKNGFDRNGTVLAGLQFNIVDWVYLFAEGGAVINPSMAQKAGLAASGGVGLTCNFGKYSGLMAEGGYVALQNGAKVDNMFQARIGYVIRPGITERDRVDIDIKQHNAERLGNLTEENKLLKSDLKRQQEANDTLMATLNKASDLFAAMERRLDDCNTQLTKATSDAAIGMGGASPLFQIFFDYASSDVTPIEEAKVAQLAAHINATEGDYRIIGYSSPDGNPDRNNALSGERARAVYWLLIAYGVNESRLLPMQGGVTTQFGDNSPLNRMVVVCPGLL